MNFRSRIDADVETVGQQVVVGAVAAVFAAQDVGAGRRTQQAARTAAAGAAGGLGLRTNR